MERTVISHDDETGIARIKFVHNDVVIEDDYNLKHVIPGSDKILQIMGIDFNKDHQLIALDKLTENIQYQIDQGFIKPAPVVEKHEYVAPPEKPNEPKIKESSPTVIKAKSNLAK